MSEWKTRRRKKQQQQTSSHKLLRKEKKSILEKYQMIKIHRKTSIYIRR